MKKNYEIYLMQHVTGSVEDDYETVEYISYLKGYRECKRMAKELSKHYGEVHVKGASYTFKAREKNPDWPYMQPLDEGLAMVKIMCYNKIPETDYNPIYAEYYYEGKVLYKEVYE